MLSAFSAGEIAMLPEVVLSGGIFSELFLSILIFLQSAVELCVAALYSFSRLREGNLRQLSRRHLVEGDPGRR
ncbi:hypothetical protein CEXT_139551 [Caerostris extrusa]|uniref:Uncharacterized protein n=1 Tax=Caerostris extrusa TaxID=172846 RepID=A0AAV4WBG0_CAEEX|nr:hypothetical protein CEXT_139551 [Caerostris extrusa]